MNLAEEIRSIRIAPGQLAICWLGQAGFLLKDCQETLVAVDPYLTNCGERIRGFKRLSPMLLQPEDLAPDYHVVTHLHFDHFDYDAIPVIARRSPKTRFLGPESCIRELAGTQIDPARCSRLDRGDCFRDDRVAIRGLLADHGAMAPDAIGVLVEMAGHTVYFSGDTAFHEELFRQVGEFRPDFAAMSVNGHFGNLTALEGAKAALLCNASYAAPCHCWTFAEHGGDPGAFCEHLRSAGKCQPICFCQGEVRVLDKDNKFLRKKESA